MYFKNHFAIHTRGYVALAILIGVFVFLAIIQSHHSVDLYNDSGRWFYEGYLTSKGELPYADFTWQYPPLSIFVLGGLMSVFGATASIAYLFTVLTSIAIGAAFYAIVRLSGLGAIVAAVVTVILAGSTLLRTDIGLFSPALYTPAWNFGVLGLLVFIIGVMQILLKDARYGVFVAAFGAFIAAASKPEFGIAAFVGALVLTLCLVISKEERSNQRWSYRNTLAFFWGVYIALVSIFYLSVAAIVGWDNLIAGVTGYGQSGLSLPDFSILFDSIALPLLGATSLTAMTVTGYLIVSGFLRVESVQRFFPSVFAHSAILVSGSLIVAILADAVVSRLPAPELVAVAVAVGFFLALSVAARLGYLPRSPARYFIVLVIGLASYPLFAVLTSPPWETIFLSPIRSGQWVPVIFLAGGAATLLFGHASDFVRDRKVAVVAIVVVVGAVITARSFFQANSGPPYVIFGLLAVVLAAIVYTPGYTITNQSNAARRVLELGTARKAVVGVLVVYAILLTVLRPIDLLNGVSNSIIDTERGKVRIDTQSAASVKFAIDLVTENTQESAAVLATAYSSWINFAADRPSSVWQTQTHVVQLTGDRATAATEQFIARPPHLVIEEYLVPQESDQPPSGISATASREGSPHLWDLIDNNYTACTEFTDGDPRRAMWGLRVYTLDPSSYLMATIGTAPPDCDQILTWSRSRDVK